MNKVYLEDLEMDEEIIVSDLKTGKEEITTVEEALELDNDYEFYKADIVSFNINVEDAIKIGLTELLDDVGVDNGEEKAEDIVDGLSYKKMDWLDDELQGLLSQYRYYEKKERIYRE